MNYEWWISWRYLLTKRKERFISLISLISILGVAVGVMALIVVISVMNGFDNDLRDKIIGANAHLLIEKEGGIRDSDGLIRQISRVEGVVACSPYINGQAMLRAKDRVVGVTAKGIDPQRELQVSRIGKYLISGDLSFSDKETIVIGKELANNFGLDLKSRVYLVSPVSGLSFPLRVCGIFNSGMYEFDANLVFLDLKEAENIFGAAGMVSGIEVKIKDLYSAPKIKRVIQDILGFPYMVRTWMELNKNLFSALKLEKTTMFIILALIVLVACFNIVSTLIMMVIEKCKDIGILKSIGATNRSIKKIFTWEGLTIGLVGTALGTILGLSLCYILKRYQFIKLPPDIYYIDRLPVEVQWQDTAIIVLASIVISLLSTLYPAWQAARLDPVEALRYE